MTTRAGRLGLLILLAAAGYQLLCSFQPLSFLNQHVLVVDDAYYYFQVSQNFARIGWPTFDGIHSTSGIQLAWALLLAGFAKFVAGRMAFLRAVLIASAILNVTAGLLLRRAGREWHSAWLGEALAAIWAGFMLGLSPTMVGLEYPLHIVVLLVIVLLWWRILQAPGATRPGQLVWLGVALALNYWVRLDAAVISVLISILVIAAVARAPVPNRSLPRQILLLLLPQAIGAAGYVLTCLKLAGTPIPLSGLVKSHYASEHFAAYGMLTSAAGHLLWWVEVQLQPIWQLAHVAVPLISVPSRPWLMALPAAAIVALSVWGVLQILRRRRDDARLWQLARLLGVMWAIGAIHATVVVATVGHFSHVTEHYYGWLQLTWFLWGGLLVYLVRTSNVSARGRALWPAIGAAVFVALHLFVAVNRFNPDPNAAQSMRNRRLDAIQWINANLGQVRIGAWNAGQVGYFCDCVVVNLDGLANSQDYLSRLRAHASTEDYLRREGIQYLIDYDEPDLTMPYLAAWDHSQMFRNTIPWTHLQVLKTEPGPQMTILVLHLRGLEGGDGVTAAGQ